MGGDDWQLWVEVLRDNDLLAAGVNTIAYSYIGPELTHPIYKDGSIGQAKNHLQQTAMNLNDALASIDGKAYVSVNKAVVTQSSAAIPVVPLYIAILFKVMEEKGLHEDCIQQMYRLFQDRLYGERSLSLDDDGRIRLDDWEMRDDIQQQVASAWSQVNSDNVDELAGLAMYRDGFLQLFGFGDDGVDYDADVDPSVDIPSIQ